MHPPLAELAGLLEQERTRRRRLEARAAEVQQETQRLARERAALEARAATTARYLGDLEGAVAATREEAHRLDRELDNLTGRQAALQADRAALRSRRDVLNELEARGSGLQRGVRRLLADGRAENAPPGIRGLLADLVRVETPHARAIEAALGERAQYVVCESTPAALAALDRLRRESGGRAGLLPLDAPGTDAPAPARAHTGGDGIVASAEALVECEQPDLAPAVGRLLGDTLVVRSFEDALRLRRNGGRALRLVTLEGEVVEPSGAVVGGEGEACGGVISRRSELRDIERRLGEFRAEAERLERLREDLLERLRATEDRRRQQEAERDEARRRLVEVEKAADHLDTRRARLAEEREIIESERAEIDETIAAYGTEEDACRKDLEAAERRYAELQQAVETDAEALAARRREAAQDAERATTLRVELAHATERRDHLIRQVTDLEGQIRDYLNERDAACGQVETHRTRRDEARQQSAEARRRAAELETEKAECQSAREAEEAACRALRTRLEQADEHLASLREADERLRGDFEALRLRENEDRVRRDDLAERARDEFEVDLATVPVPEADRDWNAVKAEIADLQRKIRHLGPVNLEAISEQEALEKAIAFEAAQRADLEEAERDLADLIERLNKMCRERFLETFETIRGHFRELFRKLFGGGKADLLLEGQEPAEGDPSGDVLEAGIEIVASPPGKALRNIQMLSGGELDESNVDRFNRMLREFLDRSQFIIITHSKRTVTMADVLYGITMEEKGVSKRVAVKLNRPLEKVA